MKLVIVSLFISTLFTSCCVFPDWGEAAYLDKNYENRSNDNKPMVLFPLNSHSVNYYYDHKRVQFWFDCYLKNGTKDTVLFNRLNYSLRSEKTEYIQEPMRYVDYDVSLKTHTMPDSIKIAPGKSISYLFPFHSKNKMSRKEYEKAFKELLSFVYCDGVQSDTIFMAMGRSLRK